MTVETNLTKIEVAKLTAVITGGGHKRSATKDAAIKRFCKAAKEKGIGTPHTFLRLTFSDAEANLQRAITGEDGSKISGKPIPSPGLARLRSSPEAETIRQQTLEEADKALKDAAPRKKALEVVASAAETYPAPQKPSAKKAKTGSRRPSVGLDAKITSVVENPKKAGSKAHACFACYKEGQTVGEFFAACKAAGIPEGEAKANLSWDRRKEFIKIQEA